MTNSFITLPVISIVLFIASPAFGQKCNMSINEQAPGKDIVRIIKCMDERISALESIPVAGEARQGSATKPPEAEFDTGSFAVSIRSATRSGDRISMLLNLRNKTTEDVHIGVQGMNGDGATLFDEVNGTSDYSPKATGINHINPYLPGTDEFSIIPANSTISASYIFDGRVITGDSAKLNLVLWQFAKPTNRKVTASLSAKIRSKAAEGR